MVRNPSGPDLYRKNGSGEQYAVSSGEMGNPPHIAHLTALRWIPIDIDPRGDDHDAARASALAALDSLGLPLWFVMDSGRGVQAQVRLEVPGESTACEAALFKACARAIYDRLDVDQSLCEVDRVQNPNRQSRLVGTMNTKTGRVAHLLREDRQQVTCLAGDREGHVPRPHVDDEAPASDVLGALDERDARALLDVLDRRGLLLGSSFGGSYNHAGHLDLLEGSHHNAERKLAEALLARLRARAAGSIEVPSGSRGTGPVRSPGSDVVRAPAAPR